MAVEAGGVGARLRAGREKLGLTVLQVAERIHTDPKIVEAIEAENFEALGAPVYARGHIRHYAELVGESGSEINQLYSNQSKVAQPDLTRIVKVPAGTDSNKLVAPALLVIAVFAVAGAIWWVSALSKKKPQLAETHVVGDEATAPGTSAPPADSSGATDGASAPGAATASAPTPPSPVVLGRSDTPPGGAQSTKPVQPPTHSAVTSPRPTPPAPAKAKTSAPAAAPMRTSAANPTRTAAASAASAPPVVSAAEAPAAPPPRPKNQSQITLRYSADSWTEVYDSTGARLFYDVGAANSVQTVVGTPPLRVVLGNASGVSVEYNGHSKPIAKFSRPDGSVQFSIDRSGQIVRAKAVTDGG
jgi:cytoskeleton protein RodZ